MSRKSLALAIAVVVLCIGLGWGLFLVWHVVGSARSVAPTPLVLTRECAVPPAASPDSAPTPSLLEIVAQNPMLPTDYVALVNELREGGDPIPRTVADSPPLYHTGDKARFWVAVTDTSDVAPITATRCGAKILSKFSILTIDSLGSRVSGGPPETSLIYFFDGIAGRMEKWEYSWVWGEYADFVGFIDWKCCKTDTCNIK